MHVKQEMQKHISSDNSSNNYNNKSSRWNNSRRNKVKQKKKKKKCSLISWFRLLQIDHVFQILLLTLTRAAKINVVMIAHAQMMFVTQM